jgi:glycosidase
MPSSAAAGLGRSVRASRFRWLLVVLAAVLALPWLQASALPLLPSEPPFGGVASNAPPENPVDFKPDVIYQVVIDRFFDGNPANNDPPGDTGLYSADHSNWHAYWGGDLAGLTEKLPYIAGMGVTALWISPVVDNVHSPLFYNGSPLPNAGYHGYWARDDYQIDPHFGTWGDFDTLVQTAHQMGIKIIIDFDANHSNPNSGGDGGNLYQDGKLVANYANDTAGWFHHNGGILNFDDLYSAQYENLFDLADLAQENPQVDAYLKGAITRFLQHDVDGIRFDAVKHMPGGWLTTVNDMIQAEGPHYLVGEWPSSGIADPLHTSQLRFANNSGMALLDFSMNAAIQNVFATGDSMVELDGTQQHINQDFLWPLDQPLFIDNHDNPRFLNLRMSHDLLNDALAFTLTAPGIPIIYYGTEQYLVDNTNGGNDPYNRPMMANFSTTTAAYQLISALGHLRHANPALAYGALRSLVLGKDVYVYERQFGSNVVLVAINRILNKAMSLASLATDLPTGRYTDVLGGRFAGGDLLVQADGSTQGMTLQPSEVGVWQFTAAEPSTPLLGSVGPEMAHPGHEMILDGEGFGNLAAGGIVQIGGSRAPIKSWSAHSITVQVPLIPGGLYTLRVCPFAELCSNRLVARVASGPQVPVTFRVTGLPDLSPADHVYLTGDTPELGSETGNKDMAVGPLIGPILDHTSKFLLVSVPACSTLTYHFFIVHNDGTQTAESAPEHTVVVPCAGETSVTAPWQT